MDLHIKIGKYMLEMLMTGKEVIIENPDGGNWHISLEEDELHPWTQTLIDECEL